MEPTFSPSGRILARDADAAGAGSAPRLLVTVAKALSRSQGEGLFRLGAGKVDEPLSPAWQFWRGLAARYLSELCHVGEGGDATLAPIPPPDEATLSRTAAAAPAMVGAEYLNAETLTGVREQLDAWVREQVAAESGGLPTFLKQRAPLWHQVGRVCFHLAENRRDERYPFAFLATYAPGVAGTGRLQYQPLSRALVEFAGAENKPALVRLLRPVLDASKESSLVAELVESGDLYQALRWTPAQAYRFLQDVPALERCGLLVRMPDWWKKRPRPRAVVTIGDVQQKRFDTDNLLDFRIEIALGDERLPAAELERLMREQPVDGGGLAWLRGQWVEVDRDKLDAALAHWKRVEQAAEEGVSFLEGMRLLAGMPAELDQSQDAVDEHARWSEVRAGEWLAEVLAALRNPENAPQPEADGLNATLRPYQVTGVKWLWLLTQLGLGGCLADDMGLGKTLQVLGLLMATRSTRPKKKRKNNGGDIHTSLLVLPASLVANWKAEMVRFTPTLRGRFVHPSEMPKDELRRLGENWREELQDIDVVATSYAMLLRQTWLAEVPWRYVILDEAQAIKNPTARQTKAAKRLQAQARIAMTGTPIENRLGDLWSLFDFLCPGLLGTQAKFKKFAAGLADGGAEAFAPLRNLVRPYILRRMKTDRSIIADLPEKVEMDTFCVLSRQQAAMYARLVKKLAEQLKSSEGMERRGLVLASILRLKQLCNHPSQLTGDGSFDPAESGKFRRLAALGEEIASRQERALVFTQFREMARPLSTYLAEVFGRPGLVLDGQTPVKRRRKLVEQFQQDDGPPYFVISLKAGGTGLNLTAASHVIHFDRWWNPAVEDQATDRAFRIGQQRNVLVHKFVCRGTIEQRIHDTIQQKRQLASDLLDVGAERMLTEMADDELIRFVALDLDSSTE